MGGGCRGARARAPLLKKEKRVSSDKRETARELEGQRKPLDAQRAVAGVWGQSPQRPPQEPLFFYLERGQRVGLKV